MVGIPGLQVQNFLGLVNKKESSKSRSLSIRNMTPVEIINEINTALEKGLLIRAGLFQASIYFRGRQHRSL